MTPGVFAIAMAYIHHEWPPTHVGRATTAYISGTVLGGFTGRALLHAVCGSDPARFHHIEGRFTSPVYPGEALTVRAWETADGEAVFTTSVGDRLVIDQGLLKHS